ncbi:MAG: hypothetical protein SFW67_21055 [Myxococcaceae bacterium]|nr:hypothetical protein [Myxococcaceae bacterium]
MSRREALFELSMYGGAVERRYRQLRPDVENLPWHDFDLSRASPMAIRTARSTWTEAAFQEHRTGAACAATLQALVAARAPIDLVAMASRFTLDEMVHVELCSRLTQLLGGGAPLTYDPDRLIALPREELTPLLRASELVVRNFCVGEALSIPILRGSWHAARQPLIRAVLARIVKDEAAHGAFGWLYLDWALEGHDAADRLHLARQAALTIDSIIQGWRRLPTSDLEGDDQRLGWMESNSYRLLARQAMLRAVFAPLSARGLDPVPHLTQRLEG